MVSLIAHGANMNAGDHVGFTALMEAIDENGVNRAEQLLLRGADSLVRTGKGETLFHLVTKARSFDAFEFVDRQGVDVQAADNKGFSALHALYSIF
uniref:Uncharacterized protein n=1 Tax=Chromera velia CCMP2878 TaxID=1169474 RepID=A0A0G4GKJ0_9ALVE|eukprot:Cvel_22319.t1-p1 / transcript=Cvel_22319.t1 / gene=Cvel_22319 / organism=Chromera_velia_CCMP2878 / gene_product=Putative ankyrin repeat protein RF_0381, putative / transcript_product=Putative ankyrin repeat protein RF_0381, putative / location=Cvel_scaffold2182:25453-25737(-) / protein_length=95 / sequence_SO=supercontig / SO=protein_coding / is_pseudo=false